jgi:hypothetical protein
MIPANHQGWGAGGHPGEVGAVVVVPEPVDAAQRVPHLLES